MAITGEVVGCCWLAGWLVNWNHRILELVDRLPEKQRIELCQNVGDFVASDPRVGSDGVYENSMELASLLKHVPGLVYQGPWHAVDDTGRVFTVRKCFNVEPSSWRPGPKRVL